MQYLVDNQNPRIWLVDVNHDRGRADTPADLHAILDQSYQLTRRWGYVELTPEYLQFKEALTGRTAYQYKAELTLYTRR